MSQLYADQAMHSTALSWYPKHPEALRSAAKETAAHDPAQAEALLRQALHADPTDGETLTVLAQVWRAQNRMEQADRAADLAAQLLPARAKVHLQVADHWFARGNLARALRHWDLALRIQPDLAKRLFPVLLRLANVPEGRAALGPSARHSAGWWEPFFIYASQNAARIDTLHALYVLRQSSGEPLSEAGRGAYVARLQSEGLWPEAYMVWLNGLSPEQLKGLGHLYDGGFELGRFEGGFDWQVLQRRNVKVEAGRTYTSARGKALHLVFQGKPVQEVIIEQSLVLPPGTYHLSGKVQPDKLQSANGLAWTLSCASDDRKILAASDRFLGTDEWRGFAVDFTVPPIDCAGQLLSLQVVRLKDLVLNGEIWFDDLAIEWLKDEALPETPELSTSLPDHEQPSRLR